MDHRFDALRHFRGFRYFIWVCQNALFFLLAVGCSADMTCSYCHRYCDDPDQCIYRVVELAGGFRSEAVNDRPAFMVLDGPMIMIAVGALTLCHPGPIFFRE
jgi:hypothetical protein